MMQLIIIIDLKKILHCLQKWALRCIVFLLLGQEYSQMEMNLNPNEAGLKFYEDLIDECLKI